MKAQLSAKRCVAFTKHEVTRSIPIGSILLLESHHTFHNRSIILKNFLYPLCICFS